MIIRPMTGSSNIYDRLHGVLILPIKVTIRKTTFREGSTRFRINTIQNESDAEEFIEHIAEEQPLHIRAVEMMMTLAGGASTERELARSSDAEKGLEKTISGSHLKMSS